MQTRVHFRGMMELLRAFVGADCHCDSSVADLSLLSFPLDEQNFMKIMKTNLEGSDYEEDFMKHCGGKFGSQQPKRFQFLFFLYNSLGFFTELVEKRLIL
ncbi:uncharacterized protein A4U43_C10F13350 [Asparagus officinalis]|uniref:Uncharacterized protein n=1 Tax=Asparagus officinalis TaxID=4686 RepID=A0A5P1E2G4_ASPOF|nr:uncharacterized protein A4U43_C10F13350 [Asparagus officinalis]